MGRVIFLSIALAVLWLVLSGFFDKPLLLILGAISVAGSVWLAARAGVLDVEGVPGAMMPRVFGYWIWLAGEIIKANIIVARQAVAVEPKLCPTMVRVPMTQRTNAGKATFANSITLTPGTISVDLDGTHILVHGLLRETADIEGMKAMGERVARTERIAGGGA